jgi:hypothetical protein
MKKTIIATLVAGLILFFWQFASWGPLFVHGSGMQYTPKQDALLKAMADQGLEEGAYFLPNVPQSATSEERTALQESMPGKPWAQISYHKAHTFSFPMNLLRGLVIDLVAAFFLVWILMSNRDNNFKHSLLASLAVGLIGYLTISYLDSIWFESNSIPYLIDSLVAWGLVGCWLGWFLNRKTAE